jgi:hypothetical protein
MQSILLSWGEGGDGDDRAAVYADGGEGGVRALLHLSWVILLRVNNSSDLRDGGELVLMLNKGSDN